MKRLRADEKQAYVSYDRIRIRLPGGNGNAVGQVTGVDQVTPADTVGQVLVPTL